MRRAAYPNAIALSERIYRRILVAYPAEFRRNYGPHMAQAFSDLCRDAYTQRALLGLANLWGRTLFDVLVSAVKERSVAMRKNSPMRTIMSVALLVMPILFIAVNVSIYELGINMNDPFAPLLTALEASGLSALFDALILLGPAIAIALHGLPLAREIRFSAQESTFTLVMPRKINATTMLLLAVSLLVLATFAIYLIAENAGCLIGPREVC